MPVYPTTRKDARPRTRINLKTDTMEPKYRTLVQAALIILVLAFVINEHGNDKGDQALAQETSQGQ